LPLLNSQPPYIRVICTLEDGRPVQGLATGWTLHISKHGMSDNFCTRPERSPIFTQPPVQWVQG